MHSIHLFDIFPVSLSPFTGKKRIYQGDGLQEGDGAAGGDGLQNNDTALAEERRRPLACNHISFTAMKKNVITALFSCGY